MTFNKLLLAPIIFLLLTMALKANAIPAANFSVHKFTSCIDGKEDCYAILTGKTLVKGSNQDPGTLIVYFHSMNGDVNEPFKVVSENSLASAIAKEYPAASFLSFNNGKLPCWGNVSARLDITNNLRSLIKDLKVKKIILMGNSMGAVTALTYAATAPSYIKQRIAGIVAISPCADLEDLYKQSTDPEVKPALEAVFGVSAIEKPFTYQSNSLTQYLAFLPVGIKFGIITATADTIIPIALQRDVVRDLNNREMTVKVSEIEGKSDPLPMKMVLESLHFVME